MKTARFFLSDWKTGLIKGIDDLFGQAEEDTNEKVSVVAIVDGGDAALSARPCRVQWR